MGSTCATLAPQKNQIIPREVVRKEVFMYSDFRILMVYMYSHNRFCTLPTVIMDTSIVTQIVILDRTDDFELS